MAGLTISGWVMFTAWAAPETLISPLQSCNWAIMSSAISMGIAWSSSLCITSIGQLTSDTRSLISSLLSKVSDGYLRL